MNMNKTAAVTALLIALASTGASAGGLLGDIIEAGCGGCGAGRTLDRVHANMGRPLDYAAANTADSLAPGVGSAWLARDHMKRSRNAPHYQYYPNRNRYSGGSVILGR